MKLTQANRSEAHTARPKPGSADVNPPPREANARPARRWRPRALTRAALIAAIYLLLTLIFAPISFRNVQFRVAEALTLLPILCADAIPGLGVGCLLANLLGGGLWYDVVFGTLATLLAAVCTRMLRKHVSLAALMPVLFNGVIVGPVVYFAYLHAPGSPIAWGALLGSMGTVALGELAVCFTLGLILIRALRRLPERYFRD